MGWSWCCFRTQPTYKKVNGLEAEPAEYVSARVDSEDYTQSFQLKDAVSSLYRKVSEWSLPKQQKNLFTMSQEEHDFLIDEHVLNEKDESESSVEDVEQSKPGPKHTVSSIYNKVTDRSQLTSVREAEHESLMDKYNPESSSSPSSYPSSKLPDFDDVVDHVV